MNLSSIRIIAAFAFSFLFIADTTHAMVYETVQSGKYSNTTTWKNGLIPPVTLGATDTVYFKAAAPFITQDKNMVMAHSDCYVVIESPVYISDITSAYHIAVQRGYIKQYSGSKMDIDSFYYSGNVHVGSVMGGANTFNNLTLSSANYLAAAIQKPTVKELLHFTDGVSTINTQFLLSSNATIYFSDNGGVKGNTAIDISQPYNLKYENPNMATGVDRFEELKGSEVSLQTLQGIEIVGNVKLNVPYDTLTLRDQLKLTSGSLEFLPPSGKLFKLYFQDSGRFGDAPNGLLYGSDSLCIYFASDEPQVNTLGKVKFASGAEKVLLLSFSLQNGINAPLVLESDLTVKNSISFGKGSLNIRNHLLDVEGVTFGMTGTGAGDGYVMMTPGGSVRAKVIKNQTYIFNIGTPGHYLPVEFTADSTSARVSVEDGVKEFGISGDDISTIQPVIAATWYFLDNTPIGKVAPGWLLPSERNGFDRNKCYVSKYTTNGWDRVPAYSTKRTSPFYQVTFRNGPLKGGVYAVFDKDNTVDVEELLQDANTVTIYPNPATGKLHLDYDGSKELTATVYDVTGKLLMTSELYNGTNTISVSALQSGLYILKVNGDGVESINRFVKE